jgi:hypothetical protein
MKKHTDEFLDSIDLEVLIPRRAKDQREALASEDTLKELMLLEIERIKNAQQRLLLASAVLAQRQADGFRMYEQQLYDREPRQFAKYATRVRYREGTISMLWGKVFHNKKGERFVKDMAMGMGRGVAKKYNKKQFTKTLEDEETWNINQVEGRYALIRATLETMQKMRSNIAEYERRVITMCETKEFD